MAGQGLSDRALAAYSHFSSHEESPALSFVFKIKDTEVNGKKLTWRDFHRVPTDEDFGYVFRGHVTDLDRAPEEGGSQAEVLDSKTRHLAAVVAAAAKVSLFEIFKAKGTNPRDLYWFMQVEVGPNTGLHVHLLVGGSGFSGSSGKWILRTLHGVFARWLVACCALDLSPTERMALRDHVTCNQFVTLLQYKHSGTGKHYTKPVSWGQMVMLYFMAKSPYQVNQSQYYIYSWDDQLVSSDLEYSERMAIYKMYVHAVEQRRAPVDVESVEPPTKKKRSVTQREVSAKEIVTELVKLRVVTIEDWMLKDPDSYIRALTSPGGQQFCQNLLDISALRVSKEFTAFQLVVENGSDLCEIYRTKPFQIFANNSYNPYKCIHAIMCVLNKQMGKRNSILFDGPATTGKSLLAQSLCGEIKNVGCYNPANVNFPFNDCVNKNVIWVEEACNFGQQVNQFKAVLSGQAIRVDQKGKGSKPIQPTPVILTSNEDLTSVRVGCELRPEHTEPIKDRLVQITLTNKLAGDFGLIPDGEWGRLFRTMQELSYQPTMASYCGHWGQLPIYGENWGHPTIKESEDNQAFTPDLDALLEAFAADARQGLSPEPTTPLGEPIGASLVADYSSASTTSTGTGEEAGLHAAVSRLCLEVSHHFNMEAIFVWIVVLLCLVLFCALVACILSGCLLWELRSPFPTPTVDLLTPTDFPLLEMPPEQTEPVCEVAPGPVTAVQNQFYFLDLVDTDGDYSMICSQDSSHPGTDTSGQGTA